ncbi:autocrine proliferation repressor protein A-like isoform X1 [Branchiostoma floridae]|uniref:Autocrine proliferation repressor protein A-like isoform X1 n=1 Tax=Branchiostoma floridae TaxID=7739 RepID=A0A9J7M636_BRAFL|nr:autocrine proliferation repressor protein A-like isoform X1 [Branchiostoma floridae]
MPRCITSYQRRRSEMNVHTPVVMPVGLLATLLVSVLVSVPPGVLTTPLDDYVNKPDPHYSYREVLEWRLKGPGYTMYLLNMTSQQWLTEEEVSRPIWWHFLTVTIPDNITHPDAAFMFIEGGRNDRKHGRLPDHNDKYIGLTRMFSLSTGSVSADLQQIPNQHIVFKNDSLQKRRAEDAIIAYTWKHFLDNPDQPDWLLRNPMTKASVRAMDTVQDFVNRMTGNQPEKFMVAGASKRGWTTWTTAAVDKRVFAIAPLVMDLLNMQKNLHHFYRALGGWTFAFDDYYDANITTRLDDPNIEKMAAIIDPLAYKERLTMPKYIIGTGGDEFFMPDDSYYYWDQLEGEKYRRWIPNAEHEMAGHEISLFFGLRAFFLSLVEDAPRPNMTWTRETDTKSGTITLQTNMKPLTIRSFHARTLDGKRRDFRLVNQPPGETKPQPHPVIWLPQDVQDMGNGTYVAEFDIPAVGWLAFFIQATFPAPHGTALEFTTEVHIIPETFPFPDCHGADCRGTLL